MERLDQPADVRPDFDLIRLQRVDFIRGVVDGWQMLAFDVGVDLVVGDPLRDAVNEMALAELLFSYLWLINEDAFEQISGWHI
jgi:hypothetical protein